MDNATSVTFLSGKQEIKQPHKYTSNPPTTDLTDDDSLRGYRTSTFLKPADSIGVPQRQAVDEAAIVAARVVRTQNKLRDLGFGNVKEGIEANVSVGNVKEGVEANVDITEATTLSIRIVSG